MLNRTTALAGAIAVAVAGSTVVELSAQSAQPAPSRTIIGCVYEEKDVPGRAPNVAERAGFLEDYILAELSPAETARPGASQSGSTPTTYSLYKLEATADEQLRALVGKRVEATGRIDAEADDDAGQPPASAQTNKTDRVIGHDRLELPEFEVASIRAVEGTCPAMPTVSR
jgi:hypothetical protein